MTSTVERYTPPANGGRASSQATTIEQSRAIADVQAAVTVAQSCPRDMAEAEREMEYVCGRMGMAEQAFYQVQNRGTGPSVHLMRELARIWGNVDYGVKELSRSDDKGESEVLATCWDMQKNTRSSRTFIVPHQRMVKVNGVQQRKDLFDLQDVYLNNQNIGARAVRECIETILPRWFTQKAQDVCRQTLANGEGEPLQDRIRKMVDGFRDKLGVSQQQIEARLGKKRGAWTPEDVAQMNIAAKSIFNGEIGRDEVFPPIAAEIVTEPCADDSDTPANTQTITSKVKKAVTADEILTPRVDAALAKARAKQAKPTPEPDDDDLGIDLPAIEDSDQADEIDRHNETDDDEPALIPVPSGTNKTWTDFINSILASVNADKPSDVDAVLEKILGAEYNPAAQLTLKQLKTVYDTLLAWRDLGTLEQMVTDAILAADVRKAD